VALRGAVRAGVDVLGPALAAMPKLVGRWRYQIILRGAQPGPFRVWLASVAERLSSASGAGVRVTIDVDPRDLM
jgi:primosomal protein N'